MRKQHYLHVVVGMVRSRQVHGGMYPLYFCSNEKGNSNVNRMPVFIRWSITYAVVGLSTSSDNSDCELPNIQAWGFTFR